MVDSERQSESVGLCPTIVTAAHVSPRRRSGEIDFPRAAPLHGTIVRVLLVVVGVALAVVASAGRASAYVDPSAGSLLLQAMLGGFAGLAVVVKLSHRRLRAWLRRRLGRGEATASDAERRP